MAIYVYMNSEYNRKKQKACHKILYWYDKESYLYGKK